jgi:FkbM family methyltransferase
MNLKALSNCESFNVGLGASERISEFFHGKESCVGSFVPGYTSEHPATRGHITKSAVRVTTGDIVLSHIGTIDVMNMDVEGYESEVLKGMSRSLGKGTIKTMFFEFCPFAQRYARSQPKEIIDLLIKSGFAVYEIEGETEGLRVSAENISALIARLGERGYTTLRATR